MASTRISSPLRGVTYQLSRLSIRQGGIPKAITSSFARPISTSTSPQASVSTITTSTDGNVPLKPFDQQTVTATIHHFPSFEPLRFETYPANHLFLPTRRDILHRAIVYEGDMTRLGTASTKTRYEVRGSARKIRPQKGSGRARLGDKKSPMLRGGGVAFGPKPRDFSSGLQKKVYDLAWRTALSYRFRKGELIIVDNAMEIESPSPRLLQHIFNSNKFGGSKGRSLLVTLEERPLLEQALGEMGRERQALTWEEVDVKDLLELSRIIIERDALNNILKSHQEDLTHHTIPPWDKSLVQKSSPKDLESIIGWSEFRTLMSVPPSEREAMRPDAYESVAYSRWKHAETLPNSAEKLNLTISAYELLVEAKDARHSLLASPKPLEHQIYLIDQRIQDISGTDPEKEAQLKLESQDLAAEVADILYQKTLLEAQALEHRVEALRWRGHEEDAEVLYEQARDKRTDVAMCEDTLYDEKQTAASLRAELARARGEVEDAETYQKEAEHWAQKVDEVRGSLGMDEEVDEEVLEEEGADEAKEKKEEKK